MSGNGWVEGGAPMSGPGGGGGAATSAGVAASSGLPGSRADQTVRGRLSSGSSMYGFLPKAQPLAKAAASARPTPTRR